MYDYFRAILPYQMAIAILPDKEDFHGIQNKIKEGYINNKSFTDLRLNFSQKQINYLTVHSSVVPYIASQN